MKRGRLARGLLVVAVCALLLPVASVVGTRSPAEIPVRQATTADWNFPATSWALGLVVPEGAQLQGGGKVGWERVDNVTALFTLPNISMPGGIVYVVISVMADGGSVLQAAVGVRPGGNLWLAYSWSIQGVDTGPLSYDWILNASEPEMVPGADVSVSIFRTSATWDLRITDEGTGTTVQRAFPSAVGSSLEVGDQELFALESYTKSAATFREMGNLTLSRLLLDGAAVAGGVYSYSDWDPNHTPLFAVGSSGTTPPSFVSLFEAGDTFVWSYSTRWVDASGSLTGLAEMAATLLVAVLVVTALVMWKTRRPPGRARG